MAKMLIARWRDWSGEGIEHLVLRKYANRIVAESAIVATVEDEALAVRYRIECDSGWRVRSVEVNRIGAGHGLRLHSDGAGHWRDEADAPIPHLDGAIDVDISMTPFTNTLPIRRLSFAVDQSHEILTAYIQMPQMKVIGDRQRYTCLQHGKLFKYESVDSDFTRDVEIDSNGLVVNYPGLFQRVI
jgi:uncharacterized protein